jgi:hypothetical protein
MNEHSKRLALIIGSIGILATLIIAGFLLFGRGEKMPSASEEAGNPFGSGGSTEFGTLPAENPFSGQADFAQGAVSGFEKGVVRRLSDSPVSGATSFTRGSSTIIRYMEQATGHIYDVDLVSGERTRISNETVPVIRHTEWLPGESGYFVAFQEEKGQVLAFLSRVNAQATSSTSTRRVLGTNILSATASSDGTNFFLIAQEPSGAVGYLLNTRTGADKKVWSFPTSEWNVSALDKGRFSLTTKAARGQSGFLFILDPQNSSFEQVIGGKTAFSALMDKKGGKIFMSENKDGGLRSSIVMRQNLAQTDVTAALADKCAWQGSDILICASAGVFPETIPDSWYQGRYSFKDSLFITDGNLVGSVANLSDHDSRGIDVEIPSVTSDGKFLLFRNKKDGILWAAEIPALTAEEKEVSNPSSGTSTPGR